MRFTQPASPWTRVTMAGTMFRVLCSLNSTMRPTEALTSDAPGLFFSAMSFSPFCHGHRIGVPRSIRERARARPPHCFPYGVCVAPAGWCRALPRTATEDTEMAPELLLVGVIVIFVYRLLPTYR